MRSKGKTSEREPLMAEDIETRCEQVQLERQRVEEQLAEVADRSIALQCRREVVQIRDIATIPYTAAQRIQDESDEAQHAEAALRELEARNMEMLQFGEPAVPAEHARAKLPDNFTEDRLARQ